MRFCLRAVVGVPGGRLREVTLKLRIRSSWMRGRAWALRRRRIDRGQMPLTVEAPGMRAAPGPEQGEEDEERSSRSSLHGQALRRISL